MFSKLFCKCKTAFEARTEYSDLRINDIYIALDDLRFEDSKNCKLFFEHKSILNRLKDQFLCLERQIKQLQIHNEEHFISEQKQKDIFIKRLEVLESKYISVEILKRKKGSKN